MTQHLEPGSYVWVCPIEDEAGHPHFAKGEFKPFVVRAADAAVAGRAAAPAADVVIRLTDYSFVVDSPLKAGTHTVRVENAGETRECTAMTLWCSSSRRGKRSRTFVARWIRSARGAPTSAMSRKRRWRAWSLL